MVIVLVVVVILTIAGCVDKENGNNKTVKTSSVEQKDRGNDTYPSTRSSGTISSSTDNILEKYSLDKLILRSDSIIVGHVVDIMPSRWNTTDGNKQEYKNEGDVIYTDVKIEVEKYLKGVYDTKIIAVRTLGGTVGQYSQLVEDQPRYEKGEKVLVFLRKDMMNGYFVTVGLIQGKMVVSPDDKVVIDGKKVSLKDIETTISG